MVSPLSPAISELIRRTPIPKKEVHNLPGHHGTYEKDLEELYDRATQIYNIVLLYLKEEAAVNKYLPAAFRVCPGIMSLEKKYGLDRLVDAYACATQLKVYSYRDVMQILHRGDDADFLPQAVGNRDENRGCLPVHRNIRGQHIFHKTEKITNMETIKTYLQQWRRKTAMPFLWIL